jgi:hypothetical protein
VEEDLILAPHLVDDQLLLVARVLICFIIHVWWPDAPSAIPQIPRKLDKPRRKRSTALTPFTGLIHTPPCAACEQGTDSPPKAAGSPPPVRPFTRGRHRTVNTHAHVCPAPAGSYPGWLGRGPIRSHGPPGGQPWRPLPCGSCHGDCSATHGTLWHGPRSSPQLLGRVIACWAEDVGSRGTARGGAIDPNTVLQWGVEAAEQRNACAAYCLHEWHGKRVQLDALYAVLRAGRGGDIRAAEAVERRSRSPPLGMDRERSREPAAPQRPGRGTHRGHGPRRVVSAC